MICYNEYYIYRFNTLTRLFISSVCVGGRIRYIEMANDYKNIVYTCSNQDKCIHILEFNTLKEIRTINALKYYKILFVSVFSDYLYYYHSYWNFSWVSYFNFYKINDSEFISQQSTSPNILEAKFDKNLKFFLIATKEFIEIYSFPEWLSLKTIPVPSFNRIFISLNNDFIGIDDINKNILLINTYSEENTIIDFPFDDDLKLCTSINDELIFVNKYRIEIFKIPKISKISRKLYLLLIFSKKIRFR